MSAMKIRPNTRTLLVIAALVAGCGGGLKYKVDDGAMDNVPPGERQTVFQAQNELEVAKSYRAFSSYVFSSPHYRHNADIQREAHKLESMAEEIFERHRLGAAS